jgi:hypothetical protein
MIVGANSKSIALTSTATITDWVTATVYSVGQYVQFTGVLYKCVVGHTSGVFATDLPTKWLKMGDTSLSLSIAVAVALG